MFVLAAGAYCEQTFGVLTIKFYCYYYYYYLWRNFQPHFLLFLHTWLYSCIIIIAKSLHGLCYASIWETARALSCLF